MVAHLGFTTRDPRRGFDSPPPPWPPRPEGTDIRRDTAVAHGEGDVAGSGDYTDSGTVTGTCQGGGTAEGDPTFTIGGETFTDHIKIKFGEPSTKGGIVHATFEGEKTKGTIELTPTKGDCVISPVTQVKGVGEFILK